MLIRGLISSLKGPERYTRINFGKLSKNNENLKFCFVLLQRVVSKDGDVTISDRKHQVEVECRNK